MFEFMNDPEILNAMMIILYVIIMIVSFSIAFIILSFKGKNLMDWALGLKNLAMSTLLLRFVILNATGWDDNETLKFWQWTFIAGAYILTLYALAREHVFYKNRNILKQKESSLDNLVPKEEEK